MRSFFVRLRTIVVAGFFFLLPVIVVYILIGKAWTSLTSVGKTIATAFGISAIGGVGGTAAFTGLLLIALCFACGLLARYSFIAAFGRNLEETLSKFIPVYETYKTKAEAKLKDKSAVLPRVTALVRVHDYWQPGYIIEQDHDENYVILLPDAPETAKGHVVLARGEQVKIIASVTADQLDASLKQLGKGLLSELRIQKQ